MPGFMAAPLAKLASLGTLTKAAATVAAVGLTMTVAGGAAGVLALPGGQAATGGAAHVAASQTTASVDPNITSSPSPTPGGTSAPAVSRSTVTSTAGSSSGPTAADVATSAAANQSSPPTVPKMPRASNVGAPAIPALPAMPSCVTNLIPTGGTPPDPMSLVAKLPACILSVITANLPLDAIQTVIRAANLPVDLSRCLSSVLSSIPGAAAGDLTRLPQLLAGCLPTDSSFPGMGSIPGMSPVSGVRSGR